MAIIIIVGWLLLPPSSSTLLSGSRTPKADATRRSPLDWAGLDTESRRQCARSPWHFVLARAIIVTFSVRREPKR